MEAAATKRRPAPVRSAHPRRRPGPDRSTVILLGLSAVLLVLALLASQLGTGAARTATRPILVVRRVYRTTVIETIRDGGSGTSMSQSVSSSGSVGTVPAAPVTRPSSH